MEMLYLRAASWPAALCLSAPHEALFRWAAEYYSGNNKNVNLQLLSDQKNEQF
jgi:hypothetical protein